MRFIHLADVHLGAVPDRGLPWSSRREEEIWDSFRRLIASLRDEPADFVLIAGDLFHSQPTRALLDEVRYLFSQIPETRVYLMAGNHDYLRKDSLYRGYDWPENVFFFQSEEAERVKDPVLPVYIYGLSYEHQIIRENLYDDLLPFSMEDEEDGWHILLAHGGDAEHIPFSQNDLLDAGFDYVALGHIHQPQILAQDRIAYSGALEPIDRGDPGPHGYIEGRIDRGRLWISFVPFASRSYENLTIDVTPKDTRLSLEERTREAIVTHGAGNLYRLVLKGIRSPEQVFFQERLMRLGNIYEVSDLTRPEYDVEELYHRCRGTIIGDYIALFCPWLTDQDSQDGSDEFTLEGIEEKALYYGLQALLETSSESV